jgi:hypothetical protein
MDIGGVLNSGLRAKMGIAALPIRGIWNHEVQRVTSINFLAMLFFNQQKRPVLTIV